MVTLNGVKEITETFKEKYNVRSDDERLDGVFIEASKLVRENALVFSKVVSRIKTIKILLIVFFPLVVALLIAAIIVGTIFFALYKIFIKPFIGLINNSSAKNGIEQGQGADKEQDSKEEQSLCPSILQVFLGAIFLPIIVALSPVIAIILAVFVIRFCQLSYDIFQPFITELKETSNCNKEIELVEKLIQTGEWKDFRGKYFSDFSDITDEQVEGYLSALRDLSKEKSPSLKVESVNQVEQGAERKVHLPI